jgi:hypothetical protein
LLVDKTWKAERRAGSEEKCTANRNRNKDQSSGNKESGFRKQELGVGKNRCALPDPNYGVKREGIGLKNRHRETGKSSNRIRGKEAVEMEYSLLFNDHSHCHSLAF